MVREGVSLDDAVNILGLPVDDAGDDEGQAATCVFLIEPVPAAELPPVSISDIPCQVMNLLSLEQSAPGPPSHISIGHEIEDVFGADKRSRKRS